MLVELDVEAVVLGHSERRQFFGETDEALARKVPAALGRRPRADPLRRRDRGGARRRRDRGGARAPARRPTSPRSSRADSAEVVDRLRADLGDRHRPHRDPRAGPGGDAPSSATCSRARGAAADDGPDPLRRLGQARQRRRAARAARHRRGAGRRRQPRPRRLRGDRRGGAAEPDGPRCRSPRSRWSSSTAGACAEPGPATRSRSAETPVFDQLWDALSRTPSSPPRAATSACPTGQMGNSEVGHLNLGAGAIVKQDLARIDDAIADGSFFENEALLAACERARAAARAAACTCSAWSPTAASTPAGSTSRRAIELAAQEGVPDLVFHAFTDGRDTLPHGGARLPRGARALAAPAPGRIGTVSGRYYAMDRDTPLGADQARLRRDRPRRRACSAASAAEAIADVLRARRDRRVRQADRDRRLRRRRRRRRRDLRQLPPRPRPAADPGARRARTSTSSRAAAARCST